MAGVILILLAVVMSGSAIAETKLTPQLEDRARVLFLQLRCVVCQNQSIGDSDADVAKDLREIVREQIQAGQTDAQIKQFLVDRYGEFILLNPVFAWHTLVLWAAPLFLLFVGGLLAWRVTRNRQVATVGGNLSDEEEAALNAIIERRSQ